MTRKEGSGLVRKTTAAIEELVAAAFCGQRDVSALVRRIDHEVDLGRCGIPGAEAVRWLYQLADDTGLDVVSAVTPTPDNLGDVRLTLRDGTFVWIEVKAQTTKNFGDLLQADWVRDETDALRWLALNDARFQRLISPWIKDSLEVYDAKFQFSGLSFEQLWLADVALLHDRPRRATAGVYSAGDLAGFLGRKYFLHLTLEGARLTRLDRLPLVDRVLSGGKAHLDIQPGQTCEARIWVSSDGFPTRGSIDFIYYVGYRSLNVVGRHKLHPGSLKKSPRRLL